MRVAIKFLPFLFVGLPSYLRPYPRTGRERTQRIDGKALHTKDAVGFNFHKYLWACVSIPNFTDQETLSDLPQEPRWLNGRTGCVIVRFLKLIYHDFYTLFHHQIPDYMVALLV